MDIEIAHKIFDVLKEAGESEMFRDAFVGSIIKTDVRWNFSICSGVFVVYVSKKNSLEIESFEPNSFQKTEEILKKITKAISKLQKIKK